MKMIVIDEELKKKAKKLNIKYRNEDGLIEVDVLANHLGITEKEAETLMKALHDDPNYDWIISWCDCEKCELCP